MPRSANPVPQYFTAKNKILVGGLMFYFEAGTSDPKVTFSDQEETIPNTHPVVLDSEGRLPNVFFTGTAKQVLKDSDNVQIWERDNVGDSDTPNFNDADLQFFSTTQNMIDSFSKTPVLNDIVETLGFYVEGDGGKVQWQFKGLTGQTVSQSPAQLGDALLNDPNGNQWALIIGKVLDIRSLGAIDDGVDTGTEFTGTDNRLMFIAAMNHCDPLKLTIGVYGKNYKIGFIYTNTNKTSITLTGNYYKFTGNGTLLIDDDLNDTNGLDYCFGNNSLTDASAIEPKNTHELFEMDGLSIRSRWTHSPGRRGIRPVSVSGFSSVVINKCKFYDIRNKAVIGYCNDQITFTGNTAFRCANGAFRMRSSNNILATGNHLKDGADDTLDFHTTNAIEDTDSARTSIIVTDNIIEKSEGIICLGARLTVVTGNTLKIPQGNPIVVGTGTSTEGDVSAYGIIVANNTITDPIEALIAGESFLPTFNINQGCIYVGSAISSGASTDNSIIPGDYDPTKEVFVLPWDDSGTTPPWGASNTTTNGTFSIARGRNFIIQNNSVIRTLPSVALYSEWGFGEYFTEDGFEDIPVSDDNFRANGVVLLGDINNVIVSGNTISDLPNAGVKFRGSVGADRTKTFKDILITNNVFTNIPLGIDKDGLNSTPFDQYDDWSITISNNVFNLDPYHTSTLRTSPLDGTWINSGTLTSRGVLMRGGKGMTIKDNIFENCYRPIQGNSENQEQFVMSGNVVRCDFTNAVYDASNKGVAIPGNGVEFTHSIIESDPTDVLYGKLLNQELTSAATIPTTGKYMREHFVVNAGAGTFYGWRRLTTGSGHVLNTDWIEVG